MGEAEVDATGSHQDQDARTLGERRDCERAETRFFAYAYRASQFFTGSIVGEREVSSHRSRRWLDINAIIRQKEEARLRQRGG